MRSFFDSYGKLRFCTDEDVLIQTESDPLLAEIAMYADSDDITDDAINLICNCSGTTEDLYRSLTNMSIEQMVDRVAVGNCPSETMDACLSEDSTFPRKRRFANSHDSINPETGKAKDPKRRQAARIGARKNKAQRKSSAKNFARSAKGKRFHKKLGKMNARRSRS